MWHDNLASNERSALKDLMEDKTIVSCNSDKGGLIVVMNEELYRNEAVRQLSDQLTYMRLMGGSYQRMQIDGHQSGREGVKIGIFNQNKPNL